MLKYKESLISAHHNYLVNHMLSPGFVLGDPLSTEDFWFVADMVPPGENTPRISGRLYGVEGRLLLELSCGKVTDNPSGCIFQSATGGFRLLYPSEEPLLAVHTQAFTNGYLTRIQGKLHDREGQVRMKPSYDGIQVYGEARLMLSTPFFA